MSLVTDAVKANGTRITKQSSLVEGKTELTDDQIKLLHVSLDYKPAKYRMWTDNPTTQIYWDYSVFFPAVSLWNVIFPTNPKLPANLNTPPPHHIHTIISQHTGSTLL